MKISHGDLENIQVQRNYNADRLADIIQFWIDKWPSEVTWHTIITAVDLPPVHEPSIAKRILDMCLSKTSEWIILPPYQTLSMCMHVWTSW